MIVASAAGALVAIIGIPLAGRRPPAVRAAGGAAVPLVLMAFGMSLRGAALLGRSQRTEVMVASVLKAS